MFSLENFDIDIFNKELENGEKFGIDYIHSTIIENINIDIKSFDYYDHKNKLELKSYYIICLFNSLSFMQECLFMNETFIFNNNFNFDNYSNTRDLLFTEIGMKYNFETKKWGWK